MTSTDNKPSITQKFHTPRGLNMMTFFVFLLISAGLWFVMSLNDTMERQYSITVEVVDLPQNSDVQFFLESGEKIGRDGYLGKYMAEVKEKGIKHLSKKNTDNSSLKVHFTDFQQTTEGYYYLPSSKMEAALQNYLGEGVVIVTWKPSVVAFKGLMPGRVNIE